MKDTMVHVHEMMRMWMPVGLETDMTPAFDPMWQLTSAGSMLSSASAVTGRCSGAAGMLPVHASSCEWGSDRAFV